MIDPISIITGLFLATVATGFMRSSKDENEETSDADSSTDGDE